MKRERGILSFILVFVFIVLNPMTTQASDIPQRFVMFDPGYVAQGPYLSDSPMMLVQFDSSSGMETGRFQVEKGLSVHVILFAEKLNRLIVVGHRKGNKNFNVVCFLNGNDLSVVSNEPKTYGQTRLRLWGSPHSSEIVFLSKDQRRLYIAYAGGIPTIQPRLTVYDVETGKETGSLPLKRPLQQIRVLDDGITAVAVSSGSWWREVSDFDFAEVMFSDSRKVIATTTLLFLDLSQPAITGEMELGPGQSDFVMHVTPDNRTAYVVEDRGDTANARVHVVSLANKSLLGTVDIGWSPLMSPVGSHTWQMTSDRFTVICQRDSAEKKTWPEESIAKLFVMTGTECKPPLELGPGLPFIANGRDENEAFVGWGGHLAVVDLSVPKIKTTIAFVGKIPEMPDTPNHAVILPDRRYAIVSFLNSNSINIIDLQEGKMLSRIKIGRDHQAKNIIVVVGFETSNSLAYICEIASMTLGILDLKTFSLKGEYNATHLGGLTVWSRGDDRLFMAKDFSRKWKLVSFNSAAKEKLEFTENPLFQNHYCLDYSPSCNSFLGLTEKWELLIVDKESGLETRRIKLTLKKPRPTVSLCVFNDLLSAFEFRLIGTGMTR